MHGWRFMQALVLGFALCGCDAPDASTQRQALPEAAAGMAGLREAAPVSSAGPATASIADAGKGPGDTPGMYCALNGAPAQACRMDDVVDADLAHAMRFSIGSNVVRFDGKAQGRWWSGQLDGKPAMGYELNRGHTTYSTRDLGTEFEWWYADMEHGSY